MGRFSPRETGRARAALTQSDAPRPAPGIVLPSRLRGSPPTTERPQCLPQRDHPIKHHVASPPHGRVVTEIRLVARAHSPAYGARVAPVKRRALGPARRHAGDSAPPPALG